MKNEINLLLLQFAHSFLNERISAEIFSEAYMELWKINRDHFPIQEISNETDKKEYFLGECIGSLFIACDSYYPEPDIEFGELDEKGLKREVARLISEYENKYVRNEP